MNTGACSEVEARVGVHGMPSKGVVREGNMVKIGGEGTSMRWVLVGDGKERRRKKE